MDGRARGGRSRPHRVDSKTEAQQVCLESLASGEHDAAEPIKRHLKARSAGCRGEQAAARQGILADRIRGEVDPQFGDLPRDVGEEGIVVGPGPATAGIGIGVVRHRGTQLRDHLVSTRAAAVKQDLRPSPEPVIVRFNPVDVHRPCRSRHRTRAPRKRVKWSASVGFTAIQAWIEKMPRHDTVGAANTWITASYVLAGSGASPVGSRRTWCCGTPARRSGRQKLTSTGRYMTSRSNAAPPRDRHPFGTVGS